MDSAAGDVAAPDPPIGLGTKSALELHEAPDLGPVDPDIGLDVGGRLPDGGQVDVEELGAALQRGGDWSAGRWIVDFPGLHAR